MKILSSLQSRIFLASALLAVLCIAIAISLVNQRVTEEAERTLDREIVTTAAQVDQLRAERAQTFTLMARLIADLPKLKAAVETDDPPTVQETAGSYQAQLNASLLLITNRKGGVLYAAGGSPRAAAIAANQPAVREALAGRDSVSVLPQPHGVLQVVTVPVVLELPRHEVLGTLSAGFMLDDELAAQLKKITGSDIAFGMSGQILAATVSRDRYDALSGQMHVAGPARVMLGNEEYVVLARPLSAKADPAAAAGGPVVLMMRSRTEQLRGLQAIHTGLVVTAIVAVLLAVVVSYGVARTIVRPLAAITDVMREVAATGDLTRKIALRHRNRWDDDDARLLATTFNTLTDSVARFQREMSQKERLTSLGRLSTVIAHEVRNPLMIIKASLHGLRQRDVDPVRLREAVADIDGEVVRLNRIVNEVLDFARPIRFALAPADLNGLCRESAAAAQASGPGPSVHLVLQRSLPPITTDAERLRIALVNMLVNARHAVVARGAGAPAGPGPGSDPAQPPITLRTEARDERVAIVIADRGLGIDAADLGRVFDPYFTTKRGGTGLGLAIAKNIVEGLGGTIAVTSEHGRGTEIQIDLPFAAAPGWRADPARETPASVAHGAA
jgi:signal transduction histidine kinase